jgi:hypothetical protein
MECGRRTGWTGGPRPQHTSVRAASQALPVTSTELPSALLPASRLPNSLKISPSFLAFLNGLPRAVSAKGSVCINTFLTETALHSEIAVTRSKQSTGTFLTGARSALRGTTISTPATQKLARVKLRNRYYIHGSDTFLPGSAQQVEFAVTHSKQSTAPFLPGSRIASLAHIKSSNSDSKLSEERAWLRL